MARLGEGGRLVEREEGGEGGDGEGEYLHARGVVGVGGDEAGIKAMEDGLSLQSQIRTTPS
jgi:hypothetical protein